MSSHRPARSWSLVARRDLVVNLVSKEIKIRYMGAMLGIVWSLCNPAATALTYLLVFSYIFPSNEDRFPLYLITGIIHWTLFSQIISQSSDWLLANSHLLKKVYFPRVLSPLSGALTNIIFWLSGLVVYFFLFPLMGGKISTSLFLYPVILLSLISFSIGISLVLCVSHAIFRDIKHIVDVLLPLLFWATPIVWMNKNLPKEIIPWMSCNPVSVFFRCLTAILHDGISPSANDIFLSIFLGSISLAAGIIFFHNHADTAVERL